MTENLNLREKKNGFKKFINPFCVVFLGLAASWCVWVTAGVYSLRAETTVVQKSLSEINKDMEKLQKGQEEMNKQIKDNRDLTHKSQKEVLEILLDIKKKIDRKERDR